MFQVVEGFKQFFSLGCSTAGFRHQAAERTEGCTGRKQEGNFADVRRFISEQFGRLSVEHCVLREQKSALFRAFQPLKSYALLGYTENMRTKCVISFDEVETVKKR